MVASITSTYSANGNVISESVDNNNDGIADSIITYKYKRSIYIEDY
jgi:hypothetical protein